MSKNLLEIAVHGENIFVLLLNGRDGSQLKLDPADYTPVGAPIMTTNVGESLRRAPDRANAYTLSAPHVRTDLYGNSLQAIQFYRVPQNLVE